MSVVALTLARYSTPFNALDGVMSPGDMLQAYRPDWPAYDGAPLLGRRGASDGRLAAISASAQAAVTSDIYRRGQKMSARPGRDFHFSWILRLANHSKGRRTRDRATPSIWVAAGSS